MTRPLVMGILNATPDSFSDGGRFSDREAALSHARRMIGEGADILDIGGESTRPNAEPVPLQLELDRTIPLIEAIRAESPVTLSIDTMKPQVARAAIAAGATTWNDVSALAYDPGSATAAAELGCTVVLMHMRGTPKTMLRLTDYGDDIVRSVRDELAARTDAALDAGVLRRNLWLDPGLGFAKTAEQSLTLLRNLSAFVETGFPILLGASRKSFLKVIDSTAVEASDRLGASLAAALTGAQAGVAALRVHDVRETVQALKIWQATRPGTGT
jgi:dihydropteroate synthase